MGLIAIARNCQCHGCCNVLPMLWLLKGIANAMAVRNCQSPIARNCQSLIARNCQSLLQGIANHYCKALPITIARHCQLPNQVFTRKAVFWCLKGPTSQITCLELLSLIHCTGNRLPRDQPVTLLLWTLHLDGTPQLDRHALPLSHFGRSLLLLEHGQPPILTPTRQWAGRCDLGCDRRPFC